MVRVISVVLCLLMMCAMLCACGENDVSEMASEAVSEVVTSTNGEVSDTDGIIGNEDENNQNDNNTSDNNNSDNGSNNNSDNNTSSATSENSTTDSTEGVM